MSDKQDLTFSEAAKFLDSEIGSLKERTTSLEETFARMFIRIEKRFDVIEATMAAKVDIERIYRFIDGLARQFDDEEIERMAIKNQLDRHEGWHQKTATATGIKLS